MEIFLILHNVENVLGPGKRLCIWTVGCPKRCKNCETPILQKSNPKFDIDIIKYLEEIDFTEVDGVTISGGEPFFQMKGLNELVNYLSNKVDDILIYTGMKYDTLKYFKLATDIFSKISVLIDGEYIEELNANEKLRGSTNQNIIFFKEQYRDSYMKFNKQERRQVVYKFDNDYMAVGLRKKEE